MGLYNNTQTITYVMSERVMDNAKKLNLDTGVYPLYVSINTALNEMTDLVCRLMERGYKLYEVRQDKASEEIVCELAHTNKVEHIYSFPCSNKLKKYSLTLPAKNEEMAITYFNMEKVRCIKSKKPGNVWYGCNIAMNSKYCLDRMHQMLKDEVGEKEYSTYYFDR